MPLSDIDILADIDKLSVFRRIEGTTMSTPSAEDIARALEEICGKKGMLISNGLAMLKAHYRPPGG